MPYWCQDCNFKAGFFTGRPQDILAGNSRSQRTGYLKDFTMNESVRLQLT